MTEAPSFLPTRWRYGYDYYEALRRIQWISHRHYEIVHAFDSRPVVIYPALFAKRRGARLIMDWSDWFGRGGSVEERSNPVLRTILRVLETYYEENFRCQADSTTVISSTLEARALNLGILSKTILRLPNGTDPEQIRPQDQKTARNKLNLPLDALILGYLGSLFPRDADLMVQAFSQVREIHLDARLIVIGNPKTQIAISDGMMLLGFIAQSELNDYLAACDILWLPLSDTIANRGRWPSKIADYFAAGRPTVACAVGDVGSVLEKTQAGVASAPNPTSFARDTLDLMQDDELMARSALNARRAAEHEFNWKNLAQSVEAQYQNLL